MQMKTMKSEPAFEITSEWKACPWCGSSKHLRIMDGINGGKSFGFAVCCKDDCCCGPVRMTQADALRAWQTRNYKTK